MARIIGTVSLAVTRVVTEARRPLLRVLAGVAVVACRGRARTEASGGMNAERIAAVATLGLDRVSVGGLIHQARWVDLGMDLDQG